MTENFVFEDGLKRLEEIVKMLERGDAPLDESLTLFEEGMKLIKNCGTALENAEQKLKILTFDEKEMKDFEIKE